MWARAFLLQHKQVLLFERPEARTIGPHLENILACSMPVWAGGQRG